jgi:hypothetical protein
MIVWLRASLLLSILCSAGCVFSGNRFYGVLSRTERPHDFRLTVEPKYREALISHVSLFRTVSPDSAVRSRGGTEVWRIAAIAPTHAQGFQFELLITPPGFECELYPPARLNPEGNYYLRVFLQSGQQGFTKVGTDRRRYSVAVFERSLQ